MRRASVKTNVRRDIRSRCTWIVYNLEFLRPAGLWVLDNFGFSTNLYVKVSLQPPHQAFNLVIKHVGTVQKLDKWRSVWILMVVLAFDSLSSLSFPMWVSQHVNNNMLLLLTCWHVFLSDTPFWRSSVDSFSRVSFTNWMKFCEYRKWGSELIWLLTI